MSPPPSNVPVYHPPPPPNFPQGPPCAPPLQNVPLCPFPPRYPPQAVSMSPLPAGPPKSVSTSPRAPLRPPALSPLSTSHPHAVLPPTPLPPVTLRPFPTATTTPMWHCPLPGHLHTPYHPPRYSLRPPHRIPPQYSTPPRSPCHTLYHLTTLCRLPLPFTRGCLCPPQAEGAALFPLPRPRPTAASSSRSWGGGGDRGCPLTEDNAVPSRPLPLPPPTAGG